MLLKFCGYKIQHSVDTFLNHTEPPVLYWTSTSNKCMITMHKGGINNTPFELFKVMIGLPIKPTIN